AGPFLRRRLPSTAMPLLSVVIPTHNRAARLEVAIGSVLAQTIADLEVVIVDDGSTDDTPEVISRAQARDARVRTLRLAGSGGAATARNAGIGAATGAFLAFLDDDDEWAPAKAERQIDYLRSHPRIGLVSCDFHIVGGGRRLHHRGPERFKPSALGWANILMGCSFVMMHRPSFSFEPSFDESIVPAEDWDLWLRCSSEREVAIVPEPLAGYARHGVQLTGSVERLQRGDAGFFAKNEERMSANARAFHRAHLRMQGAGDERMRARLDVMRSSPPAVIATLARLSLSRRLGRILNDPGRPVRTLARAVERVD
ncbi:MAG: glycosyltransferase family 2 protein, partial [Actinomycetota bacterium]